MLRHDVMWWGAICGIVCLPLAIIAIMLTLLWPFWTPRVQDWWAERSIKSTRKRVTAIEAELKRYEEYPLISEGENIILRYFALALMSFGTLVLLLDVVIMFLTTFSWIVIRVFEKLLPAADLGTVAVPAADALLSTSHEGVITVALSAIFFVVMMIASFRMERLRLQRSPAYRRYLHKSLDKLRQRLSKEPTTPQ